MSTTVSSVSWVVYSKCMELIDKKNHDYATNEDPFKNFRQLGDEYVELGLLTRIGDKVARIINSADKNLKNESVLDSLVDCVNYCAINAVWLASETKKFMFGDLRSGVHDFLSDAIEHASHIDSQRITTTTDISCIQYSWFDLRDVSIQGKESLIAERLMRLAANAIVYYWRLTNGETKI